MSSLLLSMMMFGGDPTLPPQTDQTPIDIIAQRAKEKRIVCKSSVSTGTLFPSRNCKSQAEWERLEARSRAYMDRVMREQSDEMGARMQCMASGGGKC